MSAIVAWSCSAVLDSIKAWLLTHTYYTMTGEFVLAMFLLLAAQL